ncbi:unnamed protein product, partial [Meganyctiphanes norvegica]
GSKRDSRVEYSELPSIPRTDFQFSFVFKTSSDEGIIFYGANKIHEDFISIYVKDRLLVFSYNPGAGVAVMRSSQPVNADEWHSVIAERKNEMGSLYVDGFLQSNGNSRGSATARHIDLKPPYYVGGLNKTVTQMSHSNTEGPRFRVGRVFELSMDVKPRRNTGVMMSVHG